MEKDVRKIIQSLAETAQTATEDARDFMQEKSKTATDVVTEKTAAVRYGLEAARVKAEQDAHFTEIGRMSFLIKSGLADADEPYNGEKTPQQTIDALMILAEQEQQQLDAINEKIEAAKPKPVEKNACPNCGFEYKDGDVFCRKCGTKL